MPRVPTYERQYTSPVAPVPQYSNITGFVDSAANQIQMLGQSLVQSSDRVASVLIQQQEEKDRIDIQDAINSTREGDREFFTPLFMRKGKESMNVYGQGLEYAKQRVNTVAATLDTPDKQTAFRNRYAPILNDYLDRLLLQQIRETKTYRDAALTASNKQEISDGVLFRQDFDYVNQRRKNIESNVRQQNSDAPPEEVDVLVQDEVGRLYINVFEGLLEDDVYLAQEFYDENIEDGKEGDKSAVSGPVKVALKKKLDASLRQRQIFDRADFINAASDDPQERVEMAAESDPNIRQAVMAEVKRKNAEEKALKAEAKQKAYYENVDRIMNAASYEEAMNAISGVTAENGSVELERLAANRFKTVQPAYNPTLEQEILDAYGRGVPQEELQEYIERLNDAQKKSVTGKIQKGGPLATINRSDVKDAFKVKFQMEPTDKENPENARLFNSVWDHIEREVVNGMAPSYSNVLKAMDDYIEGTGAVMGERKGGYWGIHGGYGVDMPYIEAVKEGYSDKWLPFVRPDEKARLLKLMDNFDERMRKRAKETGVEFQALDRSELGIRLFKKQHEMRLR